MLSRELDKLLKIIALCEHPTTPVGVRDNAKRMGAALADKLGIPFDRAEAERCLAGVGSASARKDHSIPKSKRSGSGSSRKRNRRAEREKQVRAGLVPPTWLDLINYFRFSILPVLDWLLLVGELEEPERDWILEVRAGVKDERLGLSLRLEPVMNRLLECAFLRSKPPYVLANCQSFGSSSPHQGSHAHEHANG